MVEETEICGPIVLNLWGSTTDCELFWFITLWVINPGRSFPAGNCRR
jgi:hypothetical protein